MWSVPCGCYGVCKKCAMKMATGGRCKVCKQFYTQFGSTEPSNDESDDDDKYHREDYDEADYAGGDKRQGLST
eukprot:CAMPEP_0185737204 /NCGR_PEP_ID=MMETSP1171-20130828/29928_1 /TAXON_ID=374046 /ORGANISM="Helicotheca tamensis, Strain CCMP826" /LENGTH=72 /DNA_ID=CAMNT_0028408073 /DNA_START=59 /DNA_END=277 /DNA_ORIENTATION=+